MTGTHGAGRLALCAAALTTTLVEPARSQTTRYDSSLAAVELYLQHQAATGAFPGAVLLAGLNGAVVLTATAGVYGEDDPRPVSDTTVYDLASLTKVIGLTTAVMLLVADGALDLDRPVAEYLPRFRGPGKDAVTVRHLLLHSSGLPAWRPLYEEADNREQALSLVFATPLDTAAGLRYRYSDLGAILLTRIVETVSGESIDRLLERRVFHPLGMRRTTYRPPASWRAFIAPTEHDPWRGRALLGEVHDENTARLGGVSGHAGLFSTAPDLARFAFWLLDVYHGRNTPALPISRDLVRDFTRRHDAPPGSTRALGWDTPSADGSSGGSCIAASSFGHTGYTGTSIWIDPARELVIILLTNRVHPTRENIAIRRVRPVAADRVVRAIAPAVVCR